MPNLTERMNFLCAYSVQLQKNTQSHLDQRSLNPHATSERIKNLGEKVRAKEVQKHNVLECIKPIGVTIERDMNYTSCILGDPI